VLFLAQKLMAQCNVTQGDMIAMVKDNKVVDSKGTKAQYRGQSVVTIENTRDCSKRPINESFVEKLAQSMSTFFNCKYFSS
jgi:aerobic-type carbon monoxide dehydrogenase small subunit (CoxS/CutS family)